MIFPALFMVAALIQAEPVPPAEIDESQVEYFSFAERQAQLIEMARLLGRMHHMHKTCQPYDYLPDRFRDRMKEIVALEEPLEITKKKMIAAFNDGFQSTKAAYPVCDPVAEAEMQRLGKEGSSLTKRIAAPFGAIEGYDYYATGDDEEE